MKRFIFYITSFIIVALIVCMSSAHAQDSTKNNKNSAAISIEKKIANKNFVFVAEWASPMSGNRHQVTGYYTLKIKNDSLNVDLPYFGQAYIAPVDPANISMTFISTNFDYTVTNRKKGGWDIGPVCFGHSKKEAPLISFTRDKRKEALSIIL